MIKDLAIYCDGCLDWVTEVALTGTQIRCSRCQNNLIISKEIRPADSKQLRLQLARAIWGLEDKIE